MAKLSKAISTATAAELKKDLNELIAEQKKEVDEITAEYLTFGQENVKEIRAIQKINIQRMR